MPGGPPQLAQDAQTSLGKAFMWLQTTTDSGQNTHTHKSNKVEDMENRWLNHKNKHRGLNLNSACEEPCQLLPELKLLSSDVRSKISLLCDHTVAKATLRPRTKAANETRPLNERAGEIKRFKVIFASMSVGVPAKKTKILLNHLVLLLLHSYVYPVHQSVTFPSNCFCHRLPPALHLMTIPDVA